MLHCVFSLKSRCGKVKARPPAQAAAGHDPRKKSAVPAGRFPRARRVKLPCGQQNRAFRMPSACGVPCQRVLRSVRLNDGRYAAGRTVVFGWKSRVDWPGRSGRSIPGNRALSRAMDVHPRQRPVASAGHTIKLPSVPFIKSGMIRY